MKKIISFVCFCLGTRILFAQTPDTLILHFAGATPDSIQSDDCQTAGGPKGWVAGNNCYRDIGKMQLFDSTYGVAADRMVTGLLFWFAHTEDLIDTLGNDTLKFIATIWSDSSGAPGAVLGTDTLTSFDIQVDTPTMINSILRFNAQAHFSPGIDVRASRRFWAGITFSNLPGDTIGLITSSDTILDGIGVSGDFPDARTHTYEQWSDGSYFPFNDGTTDSWQLDVALGIFPILEFYDGIAENEMNKEILLHQNQPNPCHNRTEIGFSLTHSTQAKLLVYDITGRPVLNKDLQSVSSGEHRFSLDVSSLESGTYFYEINTGKYSPRKKMIIIR